MNLAQTLELIKAALAESHPELAKAWAQSGVATTGLTAYDLEAPAKTLYPVLTPLRNLIPRKSGKGGIQANWKAVTAINTAALEIGVAEGKRSGVIATTVADYLAAFRGIGLEDYVTFEAQYAGQGYEDVKARAVMGLLQSLMIGEEEVILGGNGAAVALGTTPTPTLADVATGGTFKAKTKYLVHCVALTLAGYKRASVAGGVPASVIRTNADGTTDTYGGGSGQKSAAAEITTADDGVNTHSIKASVTAVTGAVAYAWFWGADGGDIKLGAITTINSALLTAPVAAGTQVIGDLPASDNSKNALVFDGLLYQIWKSGSGGYVKTMATGTPGAGTPLTADTKGGIVEIDVALQSFWDNYRLSPRKIWLASQEAKNLNKKILEGSATAALSFTIDAKQGALLGGVIVASYLNKFTQNEIPIEIHPNLPPGTLLFETIAGLPYKLSGVEDVVDILCRQDYYQIEWPLRTRKYEYGVFADLVLRNYFPPAFGIITNIADG